ncbi:MAG: hypothetical protein JWO91_3205 [Acidobacteriaceae bacterium]|nr:hypothetical protein [Acidobacteriaceae bacterium]
MNFDEQVSRTDLITKESLSGQNASPAIDHAQLEKLPEQELDRLPFGAIQLDAEGEIPKYNDYESKLAGISKGQAIGKHFFTEGGFLHQCEGISRPLPSGACQKRTRRKISLKNPRDVSVTLFYSDLTDNIWVFIRPV